MKYEVDSIDESVVTLDTYNSDLNLVIDASKFSAQALTKEGFAFMWAGVRATHGATKGKLCFEVKIIEHLDVSHLPVDEPNPHVVRVGFSVDNSSLQLGEEPLSYGYGGTGKISSNCQFKDFGPSFMAGDCVLAVVNMDSDLVQIGFAKNGNFTGWAYKIKKSEFQGKALFPHVLSKNCSFEVNFGQRSEPYFKLPDAVKDYTFVGCLPMDLRVAGSRAPAKREDCEMIMMCGLPGAGKSVWAADYSMKNSHKKYNVLGTNNIIDKMKVMGLPRKRNYHGRWDVLIQMATKCLNSMFSIGSKLRRNYILDQTNVYPTAQRRKMKNFDGFIRKAVVVVPTETEYKRRCDKRDREEGKEIPDSAVLEMKANFKLPEVSDIFDEVIFTETQREDAEKLVKQYNEEGKAAMGPARKQFRPNEAVRDNKGFDNRKGNHSFNRGGYGNFQSEQGMRGPNTFGGDRSDFGRGGFNNRGGFSGARGGRGGGFDNFGSRDNYGSRGNYGGPGGYGDSGNFDNYQDERQGFDSNYGNTRGGYDGGRPGFSDKSSPYDTSSSGRGGYESNQVRGRGSFSGRGGYDGSRGGFDGSQNAGRGSYDGRQGGGRGSYDSSRGGTRGGYDSSRGSARGGYDNSRGNARGGYESSRGNTRGGYDSNRGGARGGYDSSRGGARGGYDSSRGGSKGSYDNSRAGGFDSSQGGYDSSRGISRGYDSGHGDRMGNNRNSYDKRDPYDAYATSGKESSSDEYSARYGSSQDYDRRGYFEQSKEGYRDDYKAGTNTSEGSRMGNYGYSDYRGDNYSAEKFSDRGYGDNSSRDYKSGTSNYGYQNVKETAPRSAYSSDTYSRDSNYSSGLNVGSNPGQEGSYSRGYGSVTQSSTTSYASRNTSSTYSSGLQDTKSNDPVQKYAGSNVTGNKSSQGYSGYSGAEPRKTRWSAETVPATPSASTYATGSTYSTGSAQSYDFSKGDPSASSYQGKQSYGYQQGVAANAPTQQWMASSASAASNTAAYGTGQAQWMQYSQQQLPTQYYSQ